MSESALKPTDQRVPATQTVAQAKKRFAYADPPYLGCAVRLYGDHPEAAIYDTEVGHLALIERLCREFPDGWALSMASTNLWTLLPPARSA